MSCPLNRNKFAGSGYSKEDTGAAKEMNDRLKELMAVREAQDGGNFKTTTSWSSSEPTGGLDSFFAVGSDKELKK